MWFDQWRGCAPKGPPAVIEKINALIKKAVESKWADFTLL
jgi:hypothetical protein